MLGQRIGQYHVLERVGRGGMGEIFTAHDDRLDRLVAIKIISSNRLSDARARARFLREALAAARLSHPFICQVFEVTEAESTPVIVMEYVRGETVQRLTASRSFPADQIGRFGREIAEALAAAHARGVVHRDISANNVMITDDGHVKLMDFGLAQVHAPSVHPNAPTSSTLSIQESQDLVGTPVYIAPELLGGARADARSDLYAVGVVLYQMATGHLPFGERAGAVLFAEVLSRPPVPPRAYSPGLPWALERVILRLLEKDPANRIQTADALTSALDAAARGESPPSGTARSVAVVPFRPLGPSEADGDLGMALADATITDLASVRALLVRPTSAVLAYQGRAVDALTVGRELSVDAVVDGSVQRLGDRIRVTVQLITTDDARPLWGTKIDRSVDELFSLQDEVSRQIVEALQVQLSSRDRERLELAERAVGPAQEHYRRGRLLLLRESTDTYNAAVEAFEQALSIDPSFAAAHAGLARAYWHIGFTLAPEADYHARAAAACDCAIALDPHLPEARLIRGQLAWSPEKGFRHHEAISETIAAISAGPGLNEAHASLGVILLHVSMVAEGMASLERAIAINPQDQWAFMHLAYCWCLLGEWRRGWEIAVEALRRAPSAWAAYQVAMADLHLGRLFEARKTIERASRQFPGEVLFFPLGAVVAALDGNLLDVHRQIGLTVQNRRNFGHYHHAQYDVACALALIGDRDQSLMWLEDAATNGFPCHAFFELDPWLREIRNEPRFRSLMQALRSECDGYRALYASLMRDSGGAVGH
jgi:TolB-like protein